MQRRALDDLTGLVRAKLAAAELPAAELRGFVTPRRLAVIAAGIPPTQPDRTEERRGPRLGASPAAVEGFLRSAGLADVNECEIRDTGRGEFYFAVVKRSGRPAAAVLPELIKSAITELPWPKSMRWPGAALRWVRPLSSILCLYDGEILPLALEGVPVGRTTSGHRFRAPGEICVSSAADYVEKLEQAYVVLDQDRRKEAIRGDLDRRAAELGVAVKPDPALLDEVTGLAEFPVVLIGGIDADFMTLPPEVLATAMRTHQKYFSCVDPDGRPAPHFLFVANNLAEDGGTAIVAGNERVLRARLADARFFWDQDRKIRLEDRVEALKDRVFHARLGSVYDKVEHIADLAGFLAGQLHFSVSPGEPVEELSHLAQRAAYLCKADLSTGMVGEFPELQGTMGRYYALHDEEDWRIADAIAGHYRPLGPSDSCPTAPVSAIVALADKFDSLVGFFGIDEKPTGSRDPFALRRAALGIVRIILENKIRLALGYTFSIAANLRVDDYPPTADGSIIVDNLLDFIEDRLKVHLREQDVRHDLIAAVFALAEDDLIRLLARVDALANFLDTEDGGNLLVAYRRASNIVTIEDRKDGYERNVDVDGSLLRLPEEKALAERLDDIGDRVGELLSDERFGEAMAALANLRQPVDAFFDKVTVNVDVPELRENRLRLLSCIRATMNQVADFSKIKG